MALTQTLAQLRTRVRQRADIENDDHVSDSELTGLINDAIRSLHDLLVNEGPDDLYATTVNITPATISTGIYPLTTLVTAGNFYKLRAIYVDDGNSTWRMLKPMQEADRQYFKEASASLTLKIEYIPHATALSADGDTFDGQDGWEEYVVCLAAIDVKTKREESPGILMNKKNQMEERIRRMSARDLGHPKRIMRNKLAGYGYGWPGTSVVDAYRIRGANIEFYRYDGLIPVRP